MRRDEWVAKETLVCRLAGEVKQIRESGSMRDSVQEVMDRGNENASF
jgi:hypothetical protein